jgi:DNA polymerase-3 subunit delta'
MPDEASAVQILSAKLCPWLKAPLETLEQAFTSGRLGHAWLLTGPRGIGKLNLALAFGASLLGTRGNSPPQNLEATLAGLAMRQRHDPSDRHPDLHWLQPEADKLTIGVEQIRSMSQALSLKGFGGRAKVVVMEPAEAMTTAAANALLKTLEEPTPSTYLLLISHQPGRLMSTVRSRCQTLIVKAPARDEAAQWLSSLEGARRLSADAVRSPVHACEKISEYIDNNINEIFDHINDIYEYNSDPQVIADRWNKLDIDLILGAVAAHLQALIRARASREGSNSITDSAGDSLHNPLPALKLTRLFGQLDATEKLREQRGTGINVEMALRALLLGFQPDRGA